MQTQISKQTQFRYNKLPVNSILQGDCIERMQQLPGGSVDFILTDPPYLVSYCDRKARSIQNDDNSAWLKPAFNQAFRVLKPNAFMVAFYGWTKVDLFVEAWRSAGFRIVGHLVFRKRYASKTRFLRYQHEQAYLLAKGRPDLPKEPIADVIDMPYTGNRFHPTQKPIDALLPLIESFSRPGDIVFDPFLRLRLYAARCPAGATTLPRHRVEPRTSRRRHETAPWCFNPAKLVDACSTSDCLTSFRSLACSAGSIFQSGGTRARDAAAICVRRLGSSA